MRQSRRARFAAGLALSSLSLSHAALAASFTLVAAQDASIYDDALNDLADGQGDLWVGVTAGALDRRALLRFDLSALPAGLQIQSATLRVHLTRSIRSGNDTVHLHRVLRSWSEGPSNGGGGSGATAVAGDVTWRHAVFPAQAWQNAGGDHQPVPLASSVMGVVPAPVPVDFSSPALLADIRQGYASPGTHHGWMLIAAPSLTGSVTAKRLASGEDGVSSLRPVLLIEAEPLVAGDDDGDVPLPFWSLGLAGVLLVTAMRRTRRHAHRRAH